MKDIAVKCVQYGNSGTEIATNERTIYEVVKAKPTKTIRNFDMGFIHSQAAQGDCKITDYRTMG